MSGESTRAALVRTAADLMAARGIDGPSLREIARVAGARNTAALQYHFGDREALLAAVLAGPGATVAEHRDRLLREGDGSLRSFARALVWPYVDVLATDGGRAYVQVLHEVWSQPRRAADLVRPDPSM
ncbi:MAG TPA: helix-turn-helix domain-containing protein, partial [Mycobacteriales bacterium]